jgi:multidrug resistance protein, MATE family
VNKNKETLMTKNNYRQLFPKITNFKAYSKEIGKLAIPIISMRIISALSGFISMLIIAKLGHDFLAAGALINTAIITTLMIAWSMVFGTSLLVAKFHGANKPQEIGSVVQQALFLGTVISIFYWFTLWNMGHILLLLKQDRHLVEISTQYFRVYAFGALSTMWLACLIQAVIGISRPQLATVWSVISLVITAVLGYVLTLGKLGMPALGIVGVGWANVIANCAILLVAVTQIACDKSFAKYEIFKFRWRNMVRLSHIKEILSFGLFVSCQIGAELIAFSISTIFIGWFGSQALAGQQIAMQISAMVMVIPYGIGQGVGIVISKNLGRKNFAIIRDIGKTANILGVGVCLVLAIIFSVFPKYVIMLYLDPYLPANQATVHIATILLIIAAVTQIFDASRSIYTNSLRGFYDAKVPMLVSVLTSGVVSLSIGYLMGFALHLGPTGIRMGFAIGFLIGAIILAKRFHRLSDPIRLQAAYV